MKKKIHFLSSKQDFNKQAFSFINCLSNKGTSEKVSEYKLKLSPNSPTSTHCHERCRTRSVVQVREGHAVSSGLGSFPGRRRELRRDCGRWAALMSSLPASQPPANEAFPSADLLRMHEMHSNESTGFGGFRNEENRTVSSALWFVVFFFNMTLCTQ